MKTVQVQVLIIGTTLRVFIMSSDKMPNVFKWPIKKRPQSRNQNNQ